MISFIGHVVVRTDTTEKSESLSPAFTEAMLSHEIIHFWKLAASNIELTIGYLHLNKPEARQEIASPFQNHQLRSLSVEHETLILGQFDLFFFNECGERSTANLGFPRVGDLRPHLVVLPKLKNRGRKPAIVRNMERIFQAMISSEKIPIRALLREWLQILAKLFKDIRNRLDPNHAQIIFGVNSAFLADVSADVDKAIYFSEKRRGVGQFVPKPFFAPSGENKRFHGSVILAEAA